MDKSDCGEIQRLQWLDLNIILGTAVKLEKAQKEVPWLLGIVPNQVLARMPPFISATATDIPLHKAIIAGVAARLDGCLLDQNQCIRSLLYEVLLYMRSGYPVAIIRQIFALTHNHHWRAVISRVLSGKLPTQDALAL